ncbi:MAG: recombinase family protein, partial [Acetobacteraceae bacterium]|nr:recombinase family protein [Acetobacteraceae bacterium]
MTTKTTATTKPAASSGAALRVAAYLRVSTGRPAEADLSLPDQRRQAEAYCAERGWRLAAVFEDAGASGTDEDRPEFRRLIAAATGPGRPFDVVLVHSLSRFARDLIVLELSVRRLERAGVRLVSITQEMADGPDGALLRRIVAAIDEHHSRENARQGFWNGARPPFGHRTAEAGRRGPRVKKVLAVDEAEAAVVRRIFGLYLGAEGAPLGVKAIAARLDAEGVRHRGKPFAVSNVHRILTAETSAGRHWFDRRDSRSRAAKPRERWVGMDVPPLVPRKAFERVQEALAAKSPRRTPPGVVSGSILLTGLAECASCGGGMTLRTGKGGRYRHYACATCAHRGRALCPGRSVPMDALDRLVLGAFAEKVLTPPRLERILAAYVARSAEAEAGRKERLARLRAEATEARAGMQRLLALV